MRGMRPLSDSEIAQVASRLGVRDRAFFVLGIRTGFRVSELLSLRVADVVNGGEVARFVGVHRRNMKGKSEGRTIPLHDEARAALSAWVAELKNMGAAAESPLFLSREDCDTWGKQLSAAGNPSGLIVPQLMPQIGARG